MELVRERVEELLERAGLRSIAPGVAVAMALVLLVVVGFAAWRWGRGAVGAGELSVPLEAPAATAHVHGGEATAVAAASGGSPSSATVVAAAATIFVDMAGEVRHPGVYELPAGSRVQAGVDAAGGMTADAVSEAVNLARVLADGEQVIVPNEKPAIGAPTAAGAGGAAGGGGAAASGPVNINTATAEALDALPGVGPSTAAKIIADRAASGPFKSVDDLGRVSGIGPKKLEQLKPLVSVN